MVVKFKQEQKCFVTKFDFKKKERTNLHFISIHFYLLIAVQGLREEKMTFIVLILSLSSLATT